MWPSLAWKLLNNSKTVLEYREQSSSQLNHSVEDIMASPCFYHPGVTAAAVCIQCGTPGCPECLEVVGGKMACRRCSPALKSRLAVQPPPPPVRPAYNPNAGLNYASSPADYVDTTPREKLNSGMMLKGIALAGVVGALGAIGIEKILFYSHFGFAFLYVFLGFAVAMSLRAFTGRGGQTMALTAVGVLIVCLGISHALYAQDLLNAARAAGDADAGVTFADAFPIAMGQLKFVHWILVAGSVFVCLTTANRES
jgi:hypothetical protein